jgi:hypothetical protein
MFPGQGERLEGEDPQHPRFGQRPKHAGAKPVVADLRIDDAVLDRGDRRGIRLLEHRLLQFEPRVAQGVELLLDRSKRRRIGEACMRRGEIAAGERRIEFARADVRALEQRLEAFAEGQLQRPDLGVGQRHHDLDAVGALRLHRDVEDALRVDALLEHVDHLRDHLVGRRAFRHPHGVGEAHAAAKVLAKPDLPLDREDLVEADRGERGDQEELEKKMLGHVAGPVGSFARSRHRRRGRRPPPRPRRFRPWLPPTP